jgi:hypothetical protein
LLEIQILTVHFPLLHLKDKPSVDTRQETHRERILNYTQKQPVKR